MVAARGESRSLKWNYETEYKRSFSPQAKLQPPRPRTAPPVQEKNHAKAIVTRSTACQTDDFPENVGTQATENRDNEKKLLSKPQQGKHRRTRMSPFMKDRPGHHTEKEVSRAASYHVSRDHSNTIVVPVKSMLEPPMQAKKTVVCQNNHNLFVSDTTKQLKLDTDPADKPKKLASEIPTPVQETHEPNLQRKKIVPYRHNHNIFVTATIPICKTRINRDTKRDLKIVQKEKESLHKVDNRESTYGREFTWKKLAEESPILRAVQDMQVSRADKRLQQPRHKLFLRSAPVQYDNGSFETEYNTRFLFHRSQSVPELRNLPPNQDNANLMEHYMQVLRDREVAYSPSKRQSSGRPRRTSAAASHDSSSRQSASSLPGNDSQLSVEDKVMAWRDNANAAVPALAHRAHGAKCEAVRAAREMGTSARSTASSVYSMSYDPSKYSS